jgi:hypothetical protein
MRSWGEGKVDDDAYEHERRGRGGGRWWHMHKNWPVGRCPIGNPLGLRFRERGVRSGGVHNFYVF